MALQLPSRNFPCSESSRTARAPDTGAPAVAQACRPPPGLRIEVPSRGSGVPQEDSARLTLRTGRTPLVSPCQLARYRSSPRSAGRVLKFSPCPEARFRSSCPVIWPGSEVLAQSAGQVPLVSPGQQAGFRSSRPVRRPGSARLARSAGRVPKFSPCQLARFRSSRPVSRPGSAVLALSESQVPLDSS
jgi:hypothetical protein